MDTRLPPLVSRSLADALLRLAWSTLVWTAWSLLLLVAVILVSRRSTGALAAPLGGVPLATLAFVATLLVTATCLAITNVAPAARNVACLGATCTLLLWGYASSFPNTPFAWLVTTWLILLIGIANLWSPWPRLGSLRLRFPRRTQATRSAKFSPIAMSVVEQEFTRVRTASGIESIRGCVLVPLAIGQRTANAHLAFCPPLSCLPTFDVEQTAGPATRIKVGQLLPYGVRLDLKLDAPAQTSEPVRIAFQANAVPTSAPAD